jgi:hypothetical protein
MREMLDGAKPPAKLSFAYSWSKLNEGGLEDLEQWLTTHPDARLACIDTLKRVRPDERRGGRIYNGDYDAVSPLNDLAQKYNVLIVSVHHTNCTAPLNETDG